MIPLILNCRDLYHYNGGVSGAALVKLRGIENLAAIEDARFYNEPTFYKVEVGGNQSVYVSTGNIRQSQFAEIVNQSSRDISIVSGMHGGPMEHY